MLAEFGFLHETPLGAGSALRRLSDVLRLPFARIANPLVRLFDIVSVELLDHVPNAVTVSAIACLVAAAHLTTCAILWLTAEIHSPLVLFCATAGTALVVTIPIVSFGQLQYRRVRAARILSDEMRQQLIRARDAAVEANSEKSRFLASMSHELRTPLNAIIGFSEILKDESFGPIGLPKYAEYAGDIFKSGHHLLSLVNEVLDLAKIESGQGDFGLDEVVSMPWVIGETCQFLNVVAAKQGVTLSTAQPVPAVHVRAGERLIRQVLMNLISNAIKFTPAGGRVVVRLSTDDVLGAIVEVVDTGIGMTADELRIAQQPFGQIDSFIARKHQGTGLGLPLAKAMVEKHGGYLTLHSAPGGGTAAVFNIPLERCVASAMPAGQAA